MVFPSRDEIKQRLSQNTRVLSKARYLRKKFADENFSAVYYAHDVSADFIAQAAMQAFPGAARVCFGDALGVVQSNAYFTRMTFPLRSGRLQNLLYRLKRAWTLPSVRPVLDAEYVVPILLCDPGKDFMLGKTLVPVNAGVLGDIVDRMARSTHRHLTEKGRLPAELAGDRVVMILGSYSESGLTSEEQERAMYTEVASRLPLTSTISLKAHPVSGEAKISRIAEALSQKHPVTIVNSDEIPIEAMPFLVKDTKVISFSYSSVSLPLLHGINVLHALDAPLIDAYFPDRSRRWMNESNELYLNQIKVVRALSAGPGSPGLPPQRD